MLSRFPKDKQDRVKEKFRRNDILAVLVAMLGPRRFLSLQWLLDDDWVTATITDRCWRSHETLQPLRQLDCGPCPAMSYSWVMKPSE